VLLTPAARRRFDTLGRIQGSHDVYAALVREVAQKNKVPLIDLDTKSQQLIQSFGVNGSTLLFNHLRPGEHPNYPRGLTDDTHFSELGARKMAQLVLAAVKDLQLSLAKHIYQPPSKK
jgi:lysophospholipase L1-like esterase